MEPKKKMGRKNPEEFKKMDLGKKNLEKKHQKNITFLWFKLISSINDNIKKKAGLLGYPIRVILLVIFFGEKR